MTDFSRSTQDIVEALKNIKDNPKVGCSLLIGAGCSESANIPLAKGFVDIIKETWPVAYNRAQEKTYSMCMGELEPGFQRKIITEKIEDSKINWAHICIATLIEKGYVDRVLTTNFDPLISRACAMLGQYPAVYDFAASQAFNAEHLPEQSIFHLHGQHTGFAQLHTEQKTKALSEHLKPLFQDASQGRLWIVVGYSGANDPVFQDHLSRIKEFEYGLYWVGHENFLENHVKEKLLNASTNTYHISGYNADSFFIELTRELGVFPPKLITKPFHHLNKIFEDIQPFPFRDGLAQKDVTDTARHQIRQAMQQAEGEEQKLLAEANHLLLKGDYQSTLNLINKSDVQQKDDSFSEVEPNAYVGQGNNLLQLAADNSGKQRKIHIQNAIENYRQALNIKSDHQDALVNWGVALSIQALAENKINKQKLFKQAIQKFQKAYNVNKNNHHALINWGKTLKSLAKTQKEPQKQTSLMKASQLFRLSLQTELMELDTSVFIQLACTEALLGRESECRKWIVKLTSAAPENFHRISDEPDLNVIRTKEWFLKLEATQRCFDYPYDWWS